MGILEFDRLHSILFIRSHLILYGNASSVELTERIREEIEVMWNEPETVVDIQDRDWLVRFAITADHRPDLEPMEVLTNVNPLNNYFRIETKLRGNISFVDGIGSNTGMFQEDNLYAGSTTAAHEYGHTLGLEHPRNLDIRGEGVPGIMYPRGTLVDAEWQYNPDGRAGDSQNGGTMHPKNRRVTPKDIAMLRLHRISPAHAVIGDFTSIWHDAE